MHAQPWSRRRDAAPAQRDLSQRPAILPWSGSLPVRTAAPCRRPLRLRNRHRRKMAAAGFAAARTSLAADAEALDQRLVALFVAAFDIVEKLATLRNKLQQAAARMIILHVRLEMLCEIGDALGEDGDLNFRRAGVTGLGCKILDQRCLRSAVIDIVFFLCFESFGAANCTRAFISLVRGPQPGCRPARSLKNAPAG